MGTATYRDGFTSGGHSAKVTLRPVSRALTLTSTEDEPAIMDLNTAAGCVAWMKELPTENLRAIAALPVDRFNILIVSAAEGELHMRDAGLR